MKVTSLISKAFGVNNFIIALFLLLGPVSYAFAACCAGHGGVASCNKTTGFQMCKDGTASPTCKCEKAKETKKAAPAAKPAPAPAAAPAPAEKTKATAPAAKTPPAKAKSTSTEKSAKGCCSGHGGVDKCNKSTGYQMCKDGSKSPTCTCR